MPRTPPIFQAAADPQSNHFSLTAATLTTPPVLAFDSSVGATEIFRMNNAASSFYEIQLNSGLSHGNGSSDMFLYVPDADFKSRYGNNVILYSQFGTDNFGTRKSPVYGPGQYAANGSFEKWGVLQDPTDPSLAAIPEPSTLALAGIATLVGLGYQRHRRRCRL